MFEKLKALIQQAGAVETFDASRFNDPLALQAEWVPQKSGGSNFRTHKLVQVDFNRIEFRTTLSAKIFYSIFILTGLGIAVGFSVYSVNSGIALSDTDFFIPFLFGMVFTGIGGLLYYSGAKPVVFDKRSGYFWKCWKAPDKAFNLNAMDDYTRLSDIHALQLISEYVRSSNNSYYSYELNLILNDGSRLNVVDHGSKEKIREDARTLSEFLGKPVWDAI